MTDEQIVKAWEKCIDVTSGCCGDDTTCPYCTDEEEGCAKCFEKLRIDVLALIKRQQAEIEDLKFPYKMQVEVSKELENKIKAEAAREFAERLKDIYALHDGLQMTIDNLVREMTEKEGGKG